MTLFAHIFARSRIRTVTALPLVVAVVHAGEATGQEQQGDPVQLRDRAQAQNLDRDRIMLGLGMSVGPAYRGSDDTLIRPLPAIDVKQGRLYANLRNGVGLNLVETSKLTIGGGVTYIQGFRRESVPEGIDRLKLGAGGRGYASFRHLSVVATIGVTKGFTGGSTKGVLVDASLAYPRRLSQRWTLTPSVSAAWADRRYNDDFYGVSLTESLASGLPTYRGTSGIRDVSASLTAVYRLTERVTLSATGSVTTLPGDVRDSPLVFKKTQPIGFVAIGYLF